MFCKSCGSEIKDGTKFCPKCGKAAAGSGARPGGEFSPAKAEDGIGRFQGEDAGIGRFQGNGAGGGRFQSEGAGGGNISFAGAGNAGGMSGIGALRSKAGSRKNLWLILAAVAVVVVVLAVWYYNANREYSVVGEWVSTDVVNINEMIDKAIEEEGFSGLQGKLIKGTFNVWSGVTENLTIVFYERGDVGMTLGGIGVNAVTYEQMSNGKLNFKLGPLTLDIKCRVRRNKMTLEFLGQKLQFRRKD